jgi:SAM-dependent methyltransferase
VSFRERLAGITGTELSVEAREATCQACGASGMVAFHEANTVPTQSCVLLDGPGEAAAYPTGDILLAFCEQCGFIQNTRFDLSLVDYSMPTEESQAFSPRFNEFANGLANRIMDSYELVGRSVLEVGCGKGDFLHLLADRGLGSGLGIDPGYLPNRTASHDADLRFERRWFDGDDHEVTGDLVITRHLMEHVPNVGEFFDWLVDAVKRTPGSALFTEVPDVARVLAEGAFWDVYYEHCSYFTLGSLARALRRSGLSVTRLELGFEDQYLLADAEPGASDVTFESEDTVAELSELVETFAERAKGAIEDWRKRISETIASGSPVAVWGGGSKAVAFVTTLGVEDVTVVDINPHKQGKWLPGTRVEVESPRVLEDRRPGLVIPMNPIYTEEISQALSDMGLEPVVTPV